MRVGAKIKESKTAGASEQRRCLHMFKAIDTYAKLLLSKLTNAGVAAAQAEVRGLSCRRILGRQIAALQSATLKFREC